MTSSKATKSDGDVLLDILMLMTKAAGIGLKSKRIAHAVQAEHAQVRRAFRALVGHEWCQYDAARDEYYATVTFWVVCHIADNAFRQTVDALDPDVLARMGMPEVPELEGRTLQ